MSEASPTQPPNVITTAELRKCLETAMETRVRQDQKVLPLAIRWESDNVEAAWDTARDTNNFNVILPTRSADNRERVTEVVAASNFHDPTANIPGSKLSMTARLSTAIPKAAGQKREPIEFSELVRELREDTPKKPTHGLLAGTRSIRLKLPGSHVPFALPDPPTLRTYFSIHVHPGLGQNGLGSLAEWVNRLPSHIVLRSTKSLKPNPNAGSSARIGLFMRS
ncbi:hypothetical protein ETB97_007315 [Aspergillus alliaceus]|uniref:Uncharacterized protein n=1 Tax=Petromyces alliaceus TaxID=209559 RepID=A0A8H6E221_PETAA|nr:hypothetical protein ETB97_007315 [Aspergillus burnettii]